MTEKEQKLRSSASEWRSFMKSIPFQDIVNEYSEILKNAENRMIVEKDTTELFRFQGRIEAVRDLITHITDVIPKALDLEEERIAREKETKNDDRE